MREIKLKLEVATESLGGERTRSLLTHQRASPRQALPVKLEPGASLDTVLIGFGASCLDQILANWEAAYDGSDPEGVHQMRVGVRRFRSALGLCSELVPRGASRALRSELRWLGTELGDARDWDVFMEETLEPLQQRFAANPGLEPLRDAAQARQAAAYTALRRALDDPRAARLALQLGVWVSSRGWRNAPLAAESARLYAPAREAGAARLERRARKVRRLGRGIERRTPAERHALRIQVKKLRYAAELLGGLYPEKRRTRRYLRRLHRVQDALGEINDGVTAERLLRELLEGLGPEVGGDLHRAAGFVAGWGARAAQERGRDLPKRWKALARQQPFWDGR